MSGGKVLKRAGYSVLPLVLQSQMPPAGRAFAAPSGRPGRYDKLDSEGL